MKDFWVYTALRFGLFVASYAVLAGLYLLLFGSGGVLFWPLILAVVVSGAASWWLLQVPRDRLARRVQTRAERATQAFEERRAREDADDS